MRDSSAPPDIALVGPLWPLRALVRAQLIEDGYEVIATDSWPIPRQFLRPGMRPRLTIVDLQGLHDPVHALDEMRSLMNPEKVLVVTALGTLTPEQIRSFGFQALSRPLDVDDIVQAATRMLARGEG